MIVMSWEQDLAANNAAGMLVTMPHKGTWFGSCYISMGILYNEMNTLLGHHDITTFLYCSQDWWIALEIK